MQILAERRNSMGFCQLILPPTPCIPFRPQTPSPHFSAAGMELYLELCAETCFNTRVQGFSAHLRRSHRISSTPVNRNYVAGVTLAEAVGGGRWTGCFGQR